MMTQPQINRLFKITDDLGRLIDAARKTQGVDKNLEDAMTSLQKAIDKLDQLNWGLT